MLGRRRPLLRAAAVGGAPMRSGSAAHGTKRTRKPSRSRSPSSQTPPAPAGLTDSALDELAKLGTLKDQGVLTQEEFVPRQQRSSQHPDRL